MLFLFFRQDGILSVISLGWWFCFPSQQILWKISLALPSILWLFLGNYRILLIKEKQLFCCSSFPKRVFIFVWKSSTSQVDYQQSLYCLSPSRHANASARLSCTHALPSLTLKKTEIARSLHHIFLLKGYNYVLLKHHLGRTKQNFGLKSPKKGWTLYRVKQRTYYANVKENFIYPSHCCFMTSRSS